MYIGLPADRREGDKAKKRFSSSGLRKAFFDGIVETVQKRTYKKKAQEGRQR